MNEVTAQTRLLVSVRSEAECRIADEADVDLVDIKEPRAGSLGAADRSTIQRIAGLLQGRRVLSAALGELRDASADDSFALPAQLALVKFGLAGCRYWPEWSSAWSAACRKLPPWVGPVAVFYADHEQAASPPWRDVIAVGTQLGCGFLLVDTFVKQGQSLLDLISLSELQEMQWTAAAAKMQLVVAGSLRLRDISRLAALRPDVVAVRSAACRGGRAGELCHASIAALLAEMQHVGLRAAPI